MRIACVACAHNCGSAVAIGSLWIRAIQVDAFDRDTCYQRARQTGGTGHCSYAEVTALLVLQGLADVVNLIQDKAQLKLFCFTAFANLSGRLFLPLEHIHILPDLTVVPSSRSMSRPSFLPGVFPSMIHSWL